MSPTDRLMATVGNTCMIRRLCSESRPPVDIRYSHVAFNQDFRGGHFDGRGDEWVIEYKYAAAHLTETCAWGGWLREG
jgi:hypothetical protein